MESVQNHLEGFVGAVIRPSDDGYDVHRRVHNGLIDKKPHTIARCRGRADIADAVRHARASKLEISVRGGGHNVGGRAVSDGGVMIDLSQMRAVHVDAERKIAVVEGGALWKDVNRETQLHGLAVTGGVVGSTGVGGLTLGGGFGWLMPKYGLALDNLIAANMVLADGSLVRASESENPDLFWAIRGGGGNFGIVSSFEFKLHPVGPMVMGGLMAFPFAQAKQVLKAWREFTTTLNDDAFTVGVQAYAPDGSGNKITGIGFGHCGKPAEAEALIKRIKAFGTPVVEHMGPIPYVALNGMIDQMAPAGALNYWKSTFMPTLSDGAIDAVVAAFSNSDLPMCQIVLEHFHGLATRVPMEATAYALRQPGFNALVLGQCQEKPQSDRMISWARKSFNAIAGFGGALQYANYLGTDDPQDAAARAAYGSNLPRLRKLKRKYDPDNIFHLNINILPD